MTVELPAGTSTITLGPNDVTTPSGVRKPDVFVVSREVARAAIDRKTRTYYGADLQPEPKVTMLKLEGGRYHLAGETQSGRTLTTDQPYPISFDPIWLTKLD